MAESTSLRRFLIGTVVVCLQGPLFSVDVWLPSASAADFEPSGSGDSLGEPPTPTPMSSCFLWTVGNGTCQPEEALGGQIVRVCRVNAAYNTTYCRDLLPTEPNPTQPADCMTVCVDKTVGAECKCTTGSRSGGDTYCHQSDGTGGFECRTRAP